MLANDVLLSGAPARVPAGARNDAASKAAGWLSRYAAGAGADVEAQTLVLFGAACALRLCAAGEVPQLRSLVGDLASRTAASYRDGAGGAYFQTRGAPTAMMAAALLDAETASTYRAACTEEWRTLAASGRLRARPAVFESCSFLGELLGVQRTPHAAARTPLLSTLIEVSPVLVDAATAYAIASEVAAATRFGDEPLGASSAEAAWLRRALAFWTRYFVWDGDLDMVAPLARALRYAGCDGEPEYADALAFVSAQQSPDGAFRAQQMALHLRAMNGGAPLDAEREIDLRLTAGALWTLAEDAAGPAALFSGRARGIAAPALRLVATGAPPRRAVERAALAASIGERARAWVENELERFNPMRHAETQRMEYALKASSELALLCGLACRSGAPPDSPYRRIAAYLWNEVFRNEALQEYLLAHVATLPAVSLYASLRQCGYEDAAYRLRLESFLREGYLDAIEYGAAVRLDMIHAVTRAGLAWPGEPAAAVYARGLMARHPRAGLLTDADAYAFTHTVFFLTDFGRDARACFSDADRRYQAAVLPPLLESYLRRGNWDIAGELLTVLGYTGTGSETLRDEAWEILARAQEADGSYAGPDTGAPASAEGAETCAETPAAPGNAEDPAWRRFADNYHTTLVMLMAVDAPASG